MHYLQWSDHLSVWSHAHRASLPASVRPGLLSRPSVVRSLARTTAKIVVHGGIKALQQRLHLLRLLLFVLLLRAPRRKVRVSAPS